VDARPERQRINNRSNEHYSGMTIDDGDRGRKIFHNYLPIKRPDFFSKKDGLFIETTFKIPLFNLSRLSGIISTESVPTLLRFSTVNLVILKQYLPSADGRIFIQIITVLITRLKSLLYFVLFPTFIMSNRSDI